MKYPSSTLAQTAPKPNFASRLADPAHPANSGSLLALLSGGHISPLKRKRERRAARRERKTERRAAKGKAPRRVRERDGTGRRIRQKRGIVSRVLKKVSALADLTSK
jgi:hypothetical protein